MKTKCLIPLLIALLLNISSVLSAEIQLFNFQGNIRGDYALISNEPKPGDQLVFTDGTRYTYQKFWVRGLIPRYFK